MSSSSEECVQQPSVRCESGLPELTINHLARMARGGNVQAFNELTNQLRPRLLVALSRRFGNQLADAEDIVQDTFTKAWRSIQSYDGERSFTAWVYTIALRRATDVSRTQKRRAQHILQLSPSDLPPDSVPQSVVDKESVGNIWATARRALTDSQYVALWLRYGEDFSVKEIATAMGKTQVATRVLLHRARARLHPHFVSEHRK